MEQASTRLVYARALEQAGETGRSVIMKQEAENAYNRALSTITGTPMEVKPALKV